MSDDPSPPKTCKLAFPETGSNEIAPEDSLKRSPEHPLSLPERKNLNCLLEKKIEELPDQNLEDLKQQNLESLPEENHEDLKQQNLKDLKQQNLEDLKQQNQKSLPEENLEDLKQQNLEDFPEELILKIASLLDPKSVLNFSHTRLLKAV
jgi:hypothetical protein